MERGHLIVARKVGMDVLVGESVVVRVLSIKGNTVRLWFDAPKDILILRSEVAEREAA